MSRAEAGLGRVNARSTYDERQAMTPEEIEKALAKIHPDLNQPFFQPAQLKEEGANIAYDKTQPDFTDSRTQFPWMIAVLDVSIATIFMSLLAAFLGAYAIFVYSITLYGVPKFLAWVASL